jgi:DNA-binding beta-propeller fold protein YncE
LQGAPVRSWGDGGQHDFLSGVIAVDKGRTLYVTTTSSTIREFDVTGRLLLEWNRGILGWSFPLGLAVDPQGRVFVADTDSNRVQEFCPPTAGMLMALSMLRVST